MDLTGPNSRRGGPLSTPSTSALWFAKTRPDLLSCGDAFIAVVKSAELWDPDNPSSGGYRPSIACQVLSGAGTDDNNRSTWSRFSGGAGRSESQNGSCRLTVRASCLRSKCGDHGV